MADQAIVERSCTKLKLAIDDDEATDFTGDLQEMLDTLVAIQVVMPDAERRMSSGKEWMNKVRAAAYGVSDLVDEFKLQATRMPAGEKMTRSVELPENNMSNKMTEVKEQLKGLVKESSEFNNAVRAKSYASNPISVPADAIIGRDEDREAIFARLSARYAREGPVILLISGQDGVGKTTMAEMVFNDTRFRYYSRSEEMSNASADDMDNITNRLHELLSGRKVLIVLDDLRMYYHEWGALKKMFSVDDKGSEVIVIATAEDTPRKDSVIQLHNLEPLSVDMCSTIVKQLAVRSENRSTKDDLERIARKVAEHCGGLPLAAQLLGRLLRFKHYEEWPALLDESLWSTDSPVELSLELSYRSMPPNLRLCLAYCGISYLPPYLVKEDVIHQWIALGLIEPSDGIISAIKLAENYIGNLLDMAFLQTANLPQDNGKDETGGILFKMHDSIRKFGHKAMEAELEVVDDPEDDVVSENCRYILIADCDTWPSESLLPAKKICAINCFLCSKMEINDDSFSVPSCLRVLNLEKTSIQKLPYSFSQLEQLGYLSLSGCSRLVDLQEILGCLKSLLYINLSGCSGLQTLPNSFGELINLVHINLSGCSGLINLPESIGMLKILRHINLSGCSGLETLPESFEKLVNLVNIDLSGCSELVNLPDSFRMLNFLRHINLSGCSGLETLPESFGKLINLVHINLSGCCGLTNLPQSFGKLANLMHLDMSGCSGLETLPGSFVKLIKLVHINLSNCSGLNKLPQSFGKLKSLAHVNLSGCSGLLTLPKSFGDLRYLLHIDLSRCYGLSELPNSFKKLQRLQHIGLSGCSGLETLPESFKGLTNLLHIDLSCCSRLSKLPGSFRYLKNLVYLDLSFWSCFEGIQIALSELTSLQRLNLSHPCCYRADHIHLEGLKKVFHKLKRLQYLNLSMLLNPISYNQSEEKISQFIASISSLYNLEHLDLSHNIFLREISSSLSRLYRLHTLDLSGCIRLKKLGEWMTRMDSLKSIILRDCKGLETYQFTVGVDDNINNYVQLEDVTSEVLEIKCLEKIKRLEEAKRIRLEQKVKLQRLRLYWTKDSEPCRLENKPLFDRCWTLDSEPCRLENKPLFSVESTPDRCWTVDSEPCRFENKPLFSVESTPDRYWSAEESTPERSMVENEPECSGQENKPDRSEEENIPDRSVVENEPEGSMLESKPQGSLQENKTKMLEEENVLDSSVEKIEPGRSVQENKPGDFVHENEPSTSEEGNKPNQSVKEIKPEGSLQENKPEDNVQDNKPSTSEQGNKPNQSVKEIKPEGSLQENKPEDNVQDNKPSTSEQGNNLEDSIQDNKPSTSVEGNKPSRPVEEIEPAEDSVQENKPKSSEEARIYHFSSSEIESVSSLREDEPDRALDQNDLLGVLEPPQNLQYLELYGYRGTTCSPSWWTKEICSYLRNLIEVTMEDFPCCTALPQFSLLPNLQKLVLKKMASITTINGSDLMSGSNRTALGGLMCIIYDMKSLEKFDTTYNNADESCTSSDIGELVVEKCPRLMFKTLPPRARRLVISECDTAMSSSVENQEGNEKEGPCTSSPVTELVLKSCILDQNHWSLLDHLYQLGTLTFENCSIDSVYSGSYSSLSELKIVSCKQVKKSEVDHTDTDLAQVAAHQRLRGSTGTSGELQDFKSLEKLVIHRCGDIASPSFDVSDLTNLKDLNILSCQKLKKWSENKDNKNRLGHVLGTRT